MRASILLSTIASFLVTASCGKHDAGASSLMHVNATEGTLYVIPDGDVTGGQVTYLIYDNGMITYMGDVSYTANQGGMISVELQPSFQGHYKADAKTIKSATYAHADVTQLEFKTLFSVDQYDALAKAATVTALDPQDDAFGALTLDLSAATVHIKTAELTGDTPIGRLTLRLSDVKPQ